VFWFIIRQYALPSSTIYAIQRPWAGAFPKFWDSKQHRHTKMLSLSLVQKPQKCVLSLVCNYYLYMTRFWNFWRDLFEKNFDWFQNSTSFKNLARNDITHFYGMVLKGKIKTSHKLSTFPSRKLLFPLMLICDTWVGCAERTSPLSGAISI